MKAAREAEAGETARLMPGIRETRRLPYTAEQMFDLVADVARYPSSCRGSSRPASARTTAAR